jgi:hypothetical protein
MKSHRGEERVSLNDIAKGKKEKKEERILF